MPIQILQKPVMHVLALSVCLNNKSEKGCKCGDKCHFRQVEAEGKPSNMSKTSGATRSVAILKESIQLSFVFQDSFPIGIHTCCRQWHDNARCTYIHSCFQSLGLDHVQYLSLSDTDAHSVNGSRKRFTAFHTQSNYFTMVAWKLETLLVICCALGAQGSLLDSLLVVVDSWPRAPSCGDVWWTVVGGRWLLDELVCGETQEEHLRNIIPTQLQQELFTLRAQLAAESGLADAMRANNNLATAQVRKDTPSLIDVKGPWSSEGNHWPRGGFPMMVEKGGIGV